MRKRACRRKRGKKGAGITEELHAPVVLKKKGTNQHSAFYKAGPMLAMPEMAERNADPLNNIKSLLPQSEKTRLELMSLPDVKGKGSPAQDVALASSVSLEGRTDAHFDGGSFSTENVRVTAAEGCNSCGEQDPCVRARGVLVSRFHVTTTVTLPSVSEFPDLTPCQRTRVQNAIDTVLAPHEQQHVQAFRQYNGVTRTPFDMTLCRSQFDSTIQGMFDSQESTRRSSAQGASDALDPFNFSVDIDCEEPSEETSALEDEGKDPSVERESLAEDNEAQTDKKAVEEIV